MEDNKNAKETISTACQAITEEYYWRCELARDFEKSRFPYDHNGVDVKDQSYKDMGIVRVEFTDDLSSKLLKLSGDSDVKLFMILGAGLAALLYRYTGSDDLIFGAPIYKQEVEGEYINTILPIRSRIKGEMTFKELLMQLREKIINGYKNQNYPLDVLLYELGIPFLENDFPLFDIALLLENIHDKKYIQHTYPDMYFSFLRTGNRLQMTLEYRSALYRKQTIERIASHYTSLLEQTLSEVNLRLSTISILSEKEKEQLLITFNLSGKEVLTSASSIVTDSKSEDKILQGYFEDQEKRTPDNIAVIWEKNGARHLSYRKLNEISNQLARLLRKKGIAPDIIVGLMVESSSDMISTILAILKAGGAYLPIDVGIPPQRVQAILRDSAAAFLMTQNHLQDKINFTNEIINLDNMMELITQESTTNPVHINNSKNLAYTVYTSGSTGIPKGVLIEHGSILNYALWRVKEYEQTKEDVCLQLLSVSFDGFCANLYPALFSGGKIVVISDKKAKNIDYIENKFLKEKITNFSLTPSYYHAIIKKIEKDGLKSLKFVVLGGEKTGVTLMELSNKKAPHIRLINEYGPTENSVATTAFLGMTLENLSTIGKPIANEYIFILGKSLELLPIGIPGELFVAGKGLSRGYLNNPELTAEKFIINPHTQKSSLNRIYATGDIARWLPDGNLELIGRRDTQVKIRGYRVELEEIESCLLNHENVKEVVVILLPGYATEQSLWAFIVPRGDRLNIDHIRDYLLMTLVPYMVPEHFICIDKVPITTTGKLDKKNLAKLATSILAGEEYVEPQTETEIKLSEIWKKTLGIQQVGVTNNFFNIGGDSIKILGLLYSINKEFTCSLKVEDLYENETIKKLAILLDKTDKKPIEDESCSVIEEMEDLKKRFLNRIEETGGKLN